MAIHRISLLGPNTKPDSSGNVYWEPYTIEDTTAVIDPLVLVFANSGTKDGCSGSFRIEDDYVGTAKLKAIWTANATSGTVVFDWSVLPRSGAEDMGAAAARTTETGSVTKAGTVFLREEHIITLTDADYAAGDIVLFELFRDTVTDTMAAKALVFGAWFEYSDA